MTLYETMFCRRSVRKFDDTPLEEQTLHEIWEYLLAIPTLAEEKLEFQRFTKDEIGGGPAPHYIVAICDPTNEAYAAVGYVLEKLDLYLQSRNIGSLWLGTKKPPVPDKRHCVILAFGKTGVPYRKEKDFSRLPLSKIANDDNAITRAVRLAPSAVNSQPWELECGEGFVVVRYHGRGPLKFMLEKRLNKIDIGIAVRFLVIALEKEGKTVTALLPQTRGNDFSVTVRYV